MPLSIKNRETEHMVRQLAELTGETLTDAIRGAVAEKYERVRRMRAVRPLNRELNEIALRCARRPLISPLSDDEILGYDELGAPTR